MEPIDFWQDMIDDPSEIVLYPLSSVQALDVSEDAKAFLSQTGLPESAAPFLDFETPRSGSFTSVAAEYGLGSEYDPYMIIGGNGSGDSIAVAADGSGTIVYFNHDKQFEKVFMNTSVCQLADSLKAFGTLVQKTQEENGEEAYLDNDIPEHLLEWIEVRLKEIDLDAMSGGCHWWHEVENVKSGKYE